MTDRPHRPHPSAKASTASHLSDDDDDHDSDDDFLTLDSNTTRSAGGTDSGRRGVGVGAGGKAVVDREALVRKKLLESFYGKSAVASVDPWKDSKQKQTGSEGGFDDDDDDVESPRAAGDRDDWDSPAFDAEAHTRRHVWNSSVHTLLETEEQLALQVRTLDSTMQTLVYENYSRFIDATDAIRSIGVNVTANEDGLNRLVTNMQAVEVKARQMEDELGSLRDQVAEKIRVKRLLSRLDSLLKLPQTLRQQISNGKYKAATKHYLSAVSILSKHSEGFESLKSIETECNSILHQLKGELQRKLSHWSGRALATSYDAESSPDDADAANTDTTRKEDSELVAVPPSRSVPLPKSLGEIFECSGTLMILLQEEDTDGFASTTIDADDLQSMSLSAAMRLLDRLLDLHMIHVQERRFADAMDSTSGDNNSSSNNLSASLSMLRMPEMYNTGGDGAVRAGASLIPVDVLHGIVETTNLFRTNFPTAETSHLVKFVQETFSTFLLHVRAILLEESQGDESNTAASGTGADDIDAVQHDVSPALNILVSSVREAANHLIETQVRGFSPEMANRFVDQVVSLTESMVRRRVDQTFFKLRQAVVQNCLVPFVERAVAMKAETTSSESPDLTPEKSDSQLQSIVQLGGSTLSDCLQLVDDTIRTIFSAATAGDGSSSGTGADLPILKDAVHSSTNRFAMWLASALEILAGGESSDPSFLVEASMMDGASLEQSAEHSLKGIEIHHHRNTAFVSEDLGDLVGDSNDLLNLIDQAHKDLLQANGPLSEAVDPDFILALAEMCRLAQGSVSESLDQSIASHMGSKKKQRGLFPSEETQGDMSDGCNEISSYFQMAGSRLVVLFAESRGSVMAEILCQNPMNQEDLMMPPAPSGEAYNALQIVKQTCVECANLFGGPERAGPVPTMEDDASSLSFLSTPVQSRKTSLQLDIERMFKEKVVIYPHPQERIEASRNAVVSIVMKVAFRAMFEHVRMSTLSEAGFRQLQIDTEFLKLMITHYINKDFTLQGSNAYSALCGLLSDVMTCAGERCSDPDIADNDDIKEEAREAVRLTMSDIGGTPVAAKFIIEERD